MQMELCKFMYDRFVEFCFGFIFRAEVKKEIIGFSVVSIKVALLKRNVYIISNYVSL